MFTNPYFSRETRPRPAARNAGAGRPAASGPQARQGVPGPRGNPTPPTLGPAHCQSMNKSQLLYVLVDMQNLKRSERVQPLDRRPRRVPSRGALAAVLFGVVVLTVFGHITAFLLFLLAGIAILAAVLRRRRSGR